MSARRIAALVLLLASLGLSGLWPGHRGVAYAAQVEVSRGPVTATVAMPDGPVQLGDPVTLSLSVEAPEGVDVLMPAFGEFLGQFAVLEYVPQSTDTGNGTRLHEQRYTLQLTRSGLQRIPPILIEFIDLRPGKPRTPAGEDSYELITDALELRVEAPAEVAADDMVAPLPPLPPRALLEPRTQMGLGAAALLLVAALAGYLWWRRGRREPAGPTPAEAALAELRELANQPCATPAEVEAFFVALSAVVRRYMENRFGVHAPELTTEEFLIAAREAHELPPEERAFIVEFLSMADRVKFAGMRPSGAAAREALQRVEMSITRTAAQAGVGAPSDTPSSGVAHA